jgi:hypothetical protein
VLCNPPIIWLSLLISVTDCPIDDCEQLEENIREANIKPAKSVAPTISRIRVASTRAMPRTVEPHGLPFFIRLCLATWFDAMMTIVTEYSLLYPVALLFFSIYTQLFWVPSARSDVTFTLVISCPPEHQISPEVGSEIS